MAKSRVLADSAEFLDGIDSDVVADNDIGSSVQAYDSNLTSFVSTFTLPTSDGTADQVLTTNGSGTLSFADAGGAALELYAENPVTPTAPSATGDNAVAIGSQAEAGGTGSIAFGLDATSTTTNTIAIGNYTDATMVGGVAIGYSAQAVGNGTNAMALGRSYATGTDSFAAAIANNTSSYGAAGTGSIAIGDSTKATGTGAVALSAFSVASGYGSFAAVRQADALGQYAVAIGNLADANQSNSFALGAWSKSDVMGKFAYASGGYVNTGESQFGLVVLRGVTTDAASKVLTSSGGTPSTTNQIILPNNSAYFFSGTIVARQQAADGTDMGAWEIKGAIRREGSAGTTALVKSVINEFESPAGWSIDLSADTTNGGLKIEVTGAAATDIRWVATVHTSEVTYA